MYVGAKQYPLLEYTAARGSATRQHRHSGAHIHTIRAPHTTGARFWGYGHDARPVGISAYRYDRGVICLQTFPDRHSASRTRSALDNGPKFPHLGSGIAKLLRE
jgi:hypothetical protein